MSTPYKRRLELFEAVQFIHVSKEGNVPVFDHFTEWVNFAVANCILYTDGADLIWGHKKLDRRIRPGSWIIRSHKDGMLKFKTDDEFKNVFEIYHEEGEV